MLRKVIVKCVTNDKKRVDVIRIYYKVSQTNQCYYIIIILILGRSVGGKKVSR